MAQVQITDLPTALALTGSEAVPIVQNGVTVQTTTGAISGAGALNYPFLTVGGTSGLTQARYLSTGSGLSLSDNGAGSTLQINLTGAAQSLDNASNGLLVKTGPTTISNTAIAVGTGLTIANADGTAGNPTVGLNATLQNFATTSGIGILSINGTSVGKFTLQGTTSQILVTNGNAAGGTPTIGLDYNPTLPGNSYVQLPSGNTSQRGSPAYGALRYNTDLQGLEAYTTSGWGEVISGAGVATFSAGTTGLSPSLPTSGAIVLSGTLNVSSGGTGASSLTGYVYGNGTSAMTSSTTIPTTNLSGKITNDQLVNNSITINGSVVSLGSSTTIAAISEVDGTANQITSTQVGSVVTLAIPDAPVFVGPVQVKGTGITSITPFSNAMAVFEANDNSYQEIYTRNLNNGSDASADFVAYNDASDLNSYFIDMGMNSSNFTSVSYPIFTPNSGYLFTGGGSSGQASDLFIGTSNPNSDIIFFTGDVQTANQRGLINGTTGNFLINTATDTGYTLNVNGTTYFGGASTFGSTVLLNADPTLGLQAATKQYVDSAAATGFTVHPSVVYATTTALPTNTYNNGSSGVGATLTATSNGALTVDGNAVTATQRILVKNESNQSHNGAYTVTQAGDAGTPYILTRATDFNVAAPGEIANNAYFLVTAGATNIGSSFILSQVATITVGTTALPFTLFNSQLTYVGGTNINVTGLTISLTGTVAATNGGTGTSTVTTGDLLYGSATNTWGNLSLGSPYKSLVVNASGTQVEWNAVALNQSTAVSGQLGVSNGGTGVSTLTGLAYGNGTSAFTAATAAQVVAVIGTTAVTNATNAAKVALTAGSGSTNYLTFSASATGNQSLNTNTSLTYNYTNNALTAGINGGTF